MSTFDKVAKEIHDLTGLNVTSLKDKKQRNKLLVRSLPYIIFGYAGDLFSKVYGLSTESDILGKLMDTVNSFGEIIRIQSHHLKGKTYLSELQPVSEFA